VSGPGFAAPASIAELGDVLTAAPRPLRLIAGGTDVLVAGRALPASGTLVDLTRIAAMRGIAVDARYLRIGACTPVAALCREAQVRALLPALADAAAQCGSVQIRNRATIGGNIANGSPIGDTPPPLIALGATLVLRKGRRRREIPLEAFFVAYGKQDRRPGEFVEAVKVPLPARGAKFAVYKVTKRHDEDITSTLGAFHLQLAKNGTVKAIRIAYGGMAATPKRAAAVEAALIGRPWTEATVTEAMAAFAADFTPLTDMRASAEYRALAARNLLMRFYLETSGGAAPFTVKRHEAA